MQPSTNPPIASISQQRLSAGGTQSCAISSTDRLYCWGRNAEGQVGTGVAPLPDPTTQPTDEELVAMRPHVLSPTLIDAAATWRSISAGLEHTCGIRSDSSLYCWGDNDSGELGIGNHVSSAGQRFVRGSVPTMVSTTRDWRQVSAGRLSHTCAIKSDGTLWCWGNGSLGKLGVGSTAPHNSPMQVGSESDWREVSAGLEHSCATKTNGTMWCWGSASMGQIGLGAGPGMATFPHQVGADTDWGTVYAGDFHTCALKGAGEAWCWGDGIHGALGIGDPAEYPDQSSLMKTPLRPINTIEYLAIAPVRVGADSDWTSIGGGRYYSCGIKAGGQLWCWGALYPRVIRNEQPPLVPARIGAGGSWRFLSTGDHHACAVTTGNLLHCWGYNGLGALGGGTTANSDTPVQVNSSLIQ